ncbi:MAG: IgGFc-binding protein, partial [Owenweeksia sp.]
KSNGNNTDIFSLKAANALGTHFIVPAQTFWSNSTTFSPQPYSSFEIVATEDGTNVSITPSKAIVGHSAGVSFSIVLNRGQTYSARATSVLGSDHLYGSEITSDKPVAVTISDDSGYNFFYGGCKDIMGDQLIPVSVIGNEYIVIKGFFQSWWGGSLSDKVYITAVKNNTDIFLDGSATAATTLNKGDQYEVSLSNADLHILASEDVYVLHISGFGCEVGAAVLPALYCTGSEQVSFTRSKNEDFYLLLLVPSGGQGSFEINNDKSLISASDFHSVSSSSGQWKVARIPFSTSEIVTGNNYIITNSNKLFHAAIINGGSITGCMYGYFSDFNLVQTDPIFHYN